MIIGLLEIMINNQQSTNRIYREPTNKLMIGI